MNPLCAVLTALLSSTAIFAADADLELFEKSVRPFLVEHCYGCHSATAKRVEGGLYLDSREAMLAGGDSGPAIVPGDPDESYLIQAVKFESFEMPPKGKRPEAEIEPLIEWVRRGAAWPESDAGPTVVRETFDREERMAAHWSWRPIGRPTVPDVADEKWPVDAVDRFVGAKLDAASLRAGPDADRAAWLRRVTFDLTGLPPSVDELNAFMADETADAKAAVVDRLLASPHFGEHWARHWLDLARYAETYGHEFDYAIPHAWKYRDYVVRALNQDVPYDQFAREQVAGDLLPQRTNPETGLDESILGSGFWMLGEAVHAPTDVLADRDIRLENQIDVFSRTFLGLSVACARCHDHKFDPIATEDYYSLFGILRATNREQAFLDRDGQIAATVEKIRAIADQPDILKSAVEAKASQSTGKSNVRADAVLFADFDSSDQGWRASGQAFEWRSLSDSPSWDWQRKAVASRGVFDSGRLGEKLEGSLRSPTFTIKHGQIHWRVRSSGATFRIAIENYFMHDRHQLLYGDTFKADQKTDGWGWVTHGGDLGNYVGKRAYLEVIDEGAGRVEIDSVWFGPRPELASPVDQQLEDSEELHSQLAALAEGLPRPERVLAVVDGESVDEPIHIRGGTRNLGEPAPRRFPVAISGEEQASIDAGSGRLEIAQRLTDSSNPFFARVAVNRVWHHLFGRGIVESVDDFGVMGQPPSHPELLDHLAASFVDDGYSMKRLIRRLVLTRTYGLASDVTDEQAEKVDPKNQLLHRANLKRLTGEQVRDAMLASTGELNSQVGGPGVPIYLTAHMTGRGRPGSSGPLDGGKRRSLYVEVRRNFLSPMMLAFDTPSPFSTLGKRNSSNVPAQSLVLMNSPFVAERAKALAERIRREGSSSAERVELAYKLVFGREATVAERDRLVAHLGNTDDTDALADVCLALFNVKEFVFLR